MSQLIADSVLDRMCDWFQNQSELHMQGGRDLTITTSATANLTTLSYLSEGYDVGEGYSYAGWQDFPIEMIPIVKHYNDSRPGFRSGGMTFRFANGDASFEVIVLSAWVYDSDLNGTIVCLASVPEAHAQQWLTFEKEVIRVNNSAMPYRGQVYIIGGIEPTFDSAVEWDDIHLPPNLKSDILKDISAFFEKGVSIYQRLNIKPFRKLLFAGVPGTGKTMLCSAIASWANAKGFFVVYVSGSNQYGAKFWKIHEALEMAASSDSPTIVIVEELDSYLEEESKAQLLNVLDGSETPTNKHGTLMIATTNHPENIDDRVLKRPGRLDRIFIVPEMDNQETAMTMLKDYLGESWKDEHAEIIPQLLGRPGAFIREVALHALTMAAYAEAEELSLEILSESLNSLIKQIEAKDDFLTEHKRAPMGLAAMGRRVNGSRFGM